jgi:hypothetical protein
MLVLILVAKIGVVFVVWTKIVAGKGRLIVDVVNAKKREIWLVSPLFAFFSKI